MVHIDASVLVSFTRNFYFDALAQPLTLVGNLKPCEFAYVTAAVLSPKLNTRPCSVETDARVGILGRVAFDLTALVCARSLCEGVPT